MDYFGINSSDELPKIKEVLADQLVEPTNMKDQLSGDEAKTDAADETEALAVTDDGELIANMPSGQAGNEYGDGKES